MNTIENLKYKYITNPSNVRRHIGKSNYEFSCGFIPKCRENSNFNIRSTDYSLLYILDGDGQYINEFGISTPLCPGMAVQRIPGVLHSTIVNKGITWLECFFSFPIELYNFLESASIVKPNVPILNPGINEYLINQFIDIHNLIEHNDINRLSLFISRSQELLTNIYQISESNNNDKSIKLTNDAISYIQQNITKHVSGKDISNELGLSYESFRKIFKLHIGISPNQYIINKRIEAAKNMIVSTDFSLSHISEILGYGDYYTFSAQFKKNCGLSPREYIKGLK